MNTIHRTAIAFPPSLIEPITTLLSYAFWIGTIVFTIGLGWAAVRFMGANPDDAPGSQDNRRNYVALVIIAGLLMSSAAGIATALIDTPAPFRPGGSGSF